MPGLSNWLTNYRITFYDTAGTLNTVDIEDRGSGNGIATYIPLEGTGSPFTIQTVNNSQDPFAPILAKKATIQFFSKKVIDTVYNADTFSQGTDNRFYVQAYTPTIVYFEGFLLMDEIEEALQNPEFGNIVSLVATDNIGTLKEQEIVQATSGNRLQDGHYDLLYYVRNALAMTGLSLNLNVVFNVFETTQPDTFSPLARAYVHSLTFEKELTKKEDCYTVLQKILTALKCRLYQYNGEWWIVRIHELRGPADTVRFIKFDPAGVELATFTETSVAQQAGNGHPVFFINADAQKTAIRPHKFDKDTFRYEYPREIVPNMDFTRGDQAFLLDPYKPVSSHANTTAFPTVGEENVFYRATDSGLYYQWSGDSYLQVSASAFEIDDWEFLRSVGASYTTPDTVPYIRRTYDLLGSENGREVVLPAKPVPDPLINQYYLLSKEVPVHHMDRVSLGVDFRLHSDLAGPSGTSSTPVLQVRFIGEDGTKYLWNDTTQGGSNTGNNRPRWVDVSAPGTFINTAYFVWHYWDLSATEDQEWQSASVELGAMPKNGVIQIALVHAYPFLAYDKIFANLQFKYHPYINGTYAKYNGQFHQVTQTEAYKANRDEDTPLSDSPKKLFKGALMKFNFVTGKYVLTENWQDEFSGEGPARLGKLLAYDLWNQYRKQRVVINGTLDGVGENMAYCALYQRFTFTDYSATKRFMCLHYDLNVKRNELRGEFIEVHDTDDENDYLTDHIFNYVQ